MCLENNFIKEGRDLHINHYGENRLNFACIRASGINQTFVNLNECSKKEFNVIDASGGYGFACLGASNSVIENAIVKAIREVGYSTDEIASKERSKLLNFLFGRKGLWIERFPHGEYHVSGRNSGSEGVELALILAKENRSSNNRNILVAFEGAWHGWTKGSTSFLEKRGNDVKKEISSFNKLSDMKVKNLPFGNFEFCKEYFEENSSEILAVILEPIQGDAGVIIPPEDFLRDIANLCKQNDIILIADEILTFARTGNFFAMNDEKGIIPTDITIIGKALGMGIAPVSLVIAKKKIKPPKGKAIATSDLRPFTCSVIYEGINYIVQENLLKNSCVLGKYLMKLLKSELVEKYPKLYKNVRGKGFFIGVELTKLSSNYVMELRRNYIENGVYIEFLIGVGKKSDNSDFIFPTMRVSPPLIATKQDIDNIVLALKGGTNSFINEYFSNSKLVDKNE